MAPDTTTAGTADDTGTRERERLIAENRLLRGLLRELHDWHTGELDYVESSFGRQTIEILEGEAAMNGAAERNP